MTTTTTRELELAELLVREPCLTAEEGRRLLGMGPEPDREDGPAHQMPTRPGRTTADGGGRRGVRFGRETDAADGCGRL